MSGDFKDLAGPKFFFNTDSQKKHQKIKEKVAYAINKCLIFVNCVFFYFHPAEIPKTWPLRYFLIMIFPNLETLEITNSWSDI